jgi:prolyl-tRNA synthetase
MQANFPDATGELKPLIMGCYGIGVSRLVSAIIEQNHDQDGIIWPKEVSPFRVIILPLDVTNPQVMQQATQLHQELEACGCEVLLDDRDERAGVKFKDADLIGVPASVVIGKKGIEEKKIELRVRMDKSTVALPVENASALIMQRLT